MSGQRARKAAHRPMLVTFIRTGERRYTVRATLDGERSAQMVQAPGYDPLMPHDLQHFIVEKCLGIEGGIFGRLAAGGTARTFHAVTDGHRTREASRVRRKQAARDKNVMPGQREDYMRSERATSICWYDWLRHSADPALRLRANGMRGSSTGTLATLSAAERADFTSQKLAEIRAEFTRLSARWSSLAVGDSFSEPW